MPAHAEWVGILLVVSWFAGPHTNGDAPRQYRAELVPLFRMCRLVAAPGRWAMVGSTRFLARMLYSFPVVGLDASARVLSVTEASARGVAGLVKDSEHGTDTVVERHGRPVAVVVSIQHFDDMRELEQDLRSAALVLARVATDSGRRSDLDQVITAFGFTREQLQHERLDDQAAGRE